MDEITISYSRVSSYLSCPAKHNFSYVERLTPKGIVRPLSFGTDFHKLLEHRHYPPTLESAWIGIRDAYNALDPKQQESLGDDYLLDLEEIFVDYQQIYSGEEVPIETEHEFKIQIATYQGIPVYFHGIIDEIYSDKIADHKTFTNAPDKGIMAMNMQSMLYAKAYELESGKKVSTILWDYIKSKPAESPIWLEKSGRFSEANSSKITPMSWLRACKERGITDPEILGKAGKYQGNIQNFFFRHEVEVIPNMVDTVWDDFTNVVKDIVTRGERNKVKNITRDCTWCNYRSLCYAQFTGADVDYVKLTDYKTRE